MAFWKESMINRLSNLINRNRSAAKISQVLCSKWDSMRYVCDMVVHGMKCTSSGIRCLCFHLRRTGGNSLQLLVTFMPEL